MNTVVRLNAPRVLRRAPGTSARAHIYIYIYREREIAVRPRAGFARAVARRLVWRTRTADIGPISPGLPSTDSSIVLCCAAGRRAALTNARYILCISYGFIVYLPWVGRDFIRAPQLLYTGFTALHYSGGWVEEYFGVNLWTRKVCGEIFSKHIQISHPSNQIQTCCTISPAAGGVRKV